LQGVADEIVIVDSGSTDRTCCVAQDFGAKVIAKPFTNFGEQKNFAANQASNDWILSLDADECLSPELRDSLLSWKSGTPDCAAYRLNRRTNYLGKWIRHSGWYPDYHLRLYRRDAAKFQGSIHEKVLAHGPAGQLKGDLLHYTVRSLDEHYSKLETYTTLAAEDLFSQGKHHWRPAMYVAAPWTFLTRFLFQLGFLDGYQGLLIAWTSCLYVWLKYRKLGQLLAGAKLETRAGSERGED
jgi:glycosyltransferase involved in cell wall biosynthesis